MSNIGSKGLSHNWETFLYMHTGRLFFFPFLAVPHTISNIALAGLSPFRISTAFQKEWILPPFRTTKTMKTAREKRLESPCSQALDLILYSPIFTGVNYFLYALIQYKQKMF